MRAEVAHIGIERLGTGGAPKHAAQYQEPGESMPEQILEPVARVERHQHAGVAQHAEQPESTDCHEPEHHDRAEQAADASGALGLQAEQCDQHEDRQRQHVGREFRHRRLDPFERAQHRYRGGDRAVAVEQRGTQNS